MLSSAIHPTTKTLQFEALQLNENRKVIFNDNSDYVLIAIDLIGMHSLNSRLGWNEVDRLIVKLFDTFRKDDLKVWRMGGDEFGLIVKREDAKGIAKRLENQDIMNLRFTIESIAFPSWGALLNSKKRAMSKIDQIKKSEKQFGFIGAVSRLAPSVKYIISGDIPRK